MAIPDYQTFMLAVLQAIGDGREHRSGDVVAVVADKFGLTAAERQELLPSGRTPIYANRIHWAATYLRQAGLACTPRWGFIQITDEGHRVLAQGPAKIDVAFLMRYPAFVAFRPRRTSASAPSAPTLAPLNANETPEESLEKSWRALRDSVADELLDRLRTCAPGFFEQVVVRLLVAMGYGGTYADAASVVGRSGDEGIDGIIKEDRLGLDAIYVQAKRWQGVVGRPAVQGFAGSLEGARARKGIMITTSSFSADAQTYVKAIEKRIVLIDGPTLAELMIEHGVGVTPLQTYVVPKVDADFFEGG